jgi:His/Glu/Gln/Arg/opine family amino acid ABC transporter permease subunit
MGYQFNLRAILPYIGSLPGAIGTTLWLSILAIVFSMVVGVFGALARTHRLRVLRAVGATYVEVLRNIPLLILLYLVYFGSSQAGWRITAFTASVISLTLHSGAYMTEVFRGGLQAIPKGQYEASASQGMTSFQTLRHIVAPQVFRAIYPALGNLFIGVLLGSSLASVVTVFDLSNWMWVTGSTTFRFFETFLVAGFVYIVLCQIVNVARLIVGQRVFGSPLDARQFR